MIWSRRGAWRWTAKPARSAWFPTEITNTLDILTMSRRPLRPPREECTYRRRRWTGYPMMARISRHGHHYLLPW